MLSNQVKHFGVIFLLFFVLTAIFTFPLVFKFTTSIPGFYSTDEPYGILWSFWWFKYSHLHKLNDYFSSFISSPFGINLAQSPIYPVSDFMSKFLTIGFGEIVAYNLQILISFLFSGVFTYLLVYRLTNDKLAAFFSGVIYSFSPFHAVRTWQHLSIAQIQWFPLYILALLKLIERTTLKNILFVAISFALITFFNYYYTYFAIIIMAVFIIFVMAFEKQNRFKILKSISLSLFISLLILSPIILPILKTALFTKEKDILMVSGYIRPFKDLIEQSVRPLSYFLPAVTHPIFGKFTENFIGSPLYGLSVTEHTLYLGWVPLVLAFTALVEKKTIGASERRNFKAINFFIILAVVSWFFSQPPWWEFGLFKIYMPSFFMYKVFPMFRAYCRFGIVLMLAIAVLAGFGLKLILEKFEAQKMKIFITTLCCCLVLFEFWNYPPFKVVDLSKYPKVYDWVKNQPDEIVIAEYPLDVKGPSTGPRELYKFYQTIHYKRIINGASQDAPAYKILSSIATLSEYESAQTLKWLGVRYVLVHKAYYDRTDIIAVLRDFDNINNNRGLKFVNDFDDIFVYEVTAEPKKPKIY